MKLLLVFTLSIFGSLSFFAQNAINFGYNVGRYDFMEVPQQNYATQFNLGWEFDNASKSLIDFNTPVNSYEIVKNMEWSSITQGVSLGILFDQEGDKMFTEVNFNGIRHSKSGERINLSNNQNEKFTMKSKNGGVSWTFGFKALDRVALYTGVSVNRYAFLYSWDGAPENTVKNQRIGFKGSELTQIKPGGRFFVLGVPVGLKVKVIQSEKFDFSIRPEHIFFMNNLMSKIDRTVYFSELIFNVNHLNLGFILSYKF